MVQLPRAPKKSELEDTSLTVQNYIKRLLGLAQIGLESKNAVSPEFKVGKIFQNTNDELDIPIIIALKRGGKPARNHPINEISVNLEELIEEPVFTDSHGEYAYLYHTPETNSLEINIGLQNFNSSDETELRYYQKVIEISVPPKKQPNKLRVTIPKVKDDNVVTKSHNDSKFMINLQVMLDETVAKGTVNMVSNTYFRYHAIGDKLSKNSINHPIEVDGNLTLELLPSKDWQKITFFIEGDEPQTFEFRRKT